MGRLAWAALALLGFAGLLPAEVVTRAVEYRDGNLVLEGTLALDPARSVRRPGVLLAHEDGGTGAPAQQRAAQLAQQGYVVLALDLYGKGVRPKDGKDAAARTRERKALRARAEAGLAQLKRQPQVEVRKLAAVGYGVGGTAVLELARGGADLEAVVCVHGDLSTSTPADAKRIKASVLALLGSDDPQIPPAQVKAFEDEMQGGGVDWLVTRFGGAVHDFTDHRAGTDLKAGRAYDDTADYRAGEAIRSFLAEAFEDAAPAPPAAPAATKAPAKAAAPAGIPEKVLKVLQYVDEHREAPQGYEGGRTFLNLERLLKQRDAKGKPIKYREWDVNPLRPGVNRGAERLVTGSDGSAYFTNDHYKSFKRIR